MSELSPNIVNADPSVSQVSETKDKASQSSASGLANFNTEPASQSIADPTGCRPIKREFSSYTRSLLRVRIPVVVTLAEKKQALGQILEMGPGQIIQFNKSCEQMLDLEVSNCKIACGEAVKVGDKFGLRITSIVPPDERFLPVRK